MKKERQRAGWTFLIVGVFFIITGCSKNKSSEDNGLLFLILDSYLHNISSCAFYPTKTLMEEIYPSGTVNTIRDCTFSSDTLTYTCNIDNEWSVDYIYTSLDKFVQKFTIVPGIVGLSEKITSTNHYIYQYALDDITHEKMLSFADTSGSFGEIYTAWDSHFRPLSGIISNGPCTGEAVIYEYFDNELRYSMLAAPDNPACKLFINIYYDEFLGLKEKTIDTTDMFIDYKYTVLERGIQCPI